MEGFSKIEFRCGATATDSELKVDGKKLVGVSSLDFEVGVNKVPEFVLRIFGEPIIDVEGKVRYMASHPENGEVGEVKKIVFVDGEEWENGKG